MAKINKNNDELGQNKNRFESNFSKRFKIIEGVLFTELKKLFQN
tara:strand:- start:88348 stop:88479 length:132 start_codon:yes stop_codon:yes gene_type:complete